MAPSVSVGIAGRQVTEKTAEELQVYLENTETWLISPLFYPSNHPITPKRQEHQRRNTGESRLPSQGGAREPTANAG